LDMTVFNRSNDIIWGCYGANAVHFSMLQEVMAAWVGVPVGCYWQISDNWHAYISSLEKVAHLGSYAPAAQAGKFDGLRIASPYEMYEEHQDVKVAGNNSVETVRAPVGEPIAKVFSMVNGPIEHWFEDLDMFLNEPDVLGYRDVFFRTVAVPMMETLRVYRDVNKTKALITANQIMATDWRLAVKQWIQRRIDKRKKAEDDGVAYE